MSGLRITKVGLLAQIQDRGRFGYGDIGITQGGAADGYSATWANKLLFNDPDAPLLEVLLGGISMVAEVDSYIALSGAKAPFSINSTPRPLWRAHHVRQGDKIEIGLATEGLRLYLAVKGGFEVEIELGSTSTTLREGWGHQITENELLTCSPQHNLPSTAAPQSLIPKYLDVATLKVVLGYQSDCFTLAQKTALFSNPYRVTQATDRMGCRLQGEPITYEAGELISEPIAYGSIQIPADGQPIVLLNERQTIGGYPKIGAVIPMDCYRLAQARPGTTVAFEEIGLEEAVRQTEDLYDFLRY